MHYHVKRSVEGIVFDVHSFATKAERKSWLLRSGFVDSHDVWYHPFTKEVAGIFDSDNLNATTIYYLNTCDQRLSPRMRGSIWIGQ